MRVRQAVQWCKDTLGYQAVMSANGASGEQRMNMERCLTRHFIMRAGENYFGRGDLIYVDMKGDQDVGLRGTWDRFGPDLWAIAKAKKAAEDAAKAAEKAAAGGGDEGGDDEGGDGGDDEE